jgi:hypothetical protein
VRRGGDTRLVIRCAAWALALCVVLSGCADTPAAGVSKAPKPVPDSALDSALLEADDVNAIFGTTGMQAHPPVLQMADHRNLLPNLNCLGVWQVDEAPIYESSHWKSVRQQLLRTPDTETWDALLVQSVVSYRTADAARSFFTQSADRWSNCTNHNVNIRVNDQALPAWKSGDLTRTDDQLAMPYTRGSGDQIRSCQHVLAVASNVVFDVVACGPQSPTFTKGAEVTATMESRLPR